MIVLRDIENYYQSAIISYWRCYKSTGSPDGQVIASRSLVSFEERKCGSISAAWYHNTPQYLPTYYELLTPFLTLHLSLLNPFPPPCTFRFQRKN